MRARGVFKLALIAAVSVGADAQSAESAWKPERALEIVVSQGAGGGTDLLARVLQKVLSEHRLAELPVTVVNKPGGGGAIGLDYVSKRSGDGHTVAIGNATLISSQLVGVARLGYLDVTPLGFLVQDYVAFAVKSDSPLKTGRDLLERLKQDPGSLSIGIGAAVGNQNHIALALAARAVGIDARRLKAVIFKSGAETETAILGGHVDAGLTSSAAFVRHLRSGAVRLIAVAAPRRLEAELAVVPTWREQGIDSVAGNWYVVYGPKDMAPAQVRYWDQALGSAVKAPEWRNYLKSKHLADSYMNSERTRNLLDEEHAKLKRVLTDLGLAK